MADYHPLDVRYKGPSTAYRGSAAKKADAPDLPKRTKHKPPPIPKTTTAPQPAMPAKPGPWGGTASPTMPMPEEPSGPPPLPMPPPRPAKRRNAGRRVFFVLAVLIAVVVFNNVLSRSTGLMTIDVNDLMLPTDGSSLKSQTL